MINHEIVACLARGIREGDPAARAALSDYLRECGMDEEANVVAGGECFRNGPDVNWGISGCLAVFISGQNSLHVYRDGGPTLRRDAAYLAGMAREWVKDGFWVRLF